MIALHRSPASRADVFVAPDLASFEGQDKIVPGRVTVELDEPVEDRHLANTFRMGASHQETAVVACHDQVAGCVALATMAGAVDEIRSAVPGFRLRGIHLPRGWVEAYPFP